MKEEQEYYTYILANHRGMLYIGMTGDLFTRVMQHRNGIGSEYTKKYQCHRLVYFEIHQYVYNAIDREKEIKKFSRKKKEALINTINPFWTDLFIQFGDPKEINRTWDIRFLPGRS